MTAPNFVVLVTDDQTFESIRRMPRLFSSAASRGVFFSNCFPNQSICQPSRATILTGQYSHNHGVIGNETDYTLMDETKTLPYALNAAGYYTGLVGKYLNQWNTSKAVPSGWTDFHGMDPTYYSVKFNDNGVVTTHGSTASDYSTTLVQSKLLTMLSAATEPFFIYGAFNAPHVTSDEWSAATPSPDYSGCTSTSKTFPHNADWNISDVSLKPAYIQALDRIDSSTESTINTNWRAVTETLYSVDIAIKAVMDSLVASGKISNTYVFITSDNGYFNGEQRIPIGKVAPYESSIRVPLIVAGPSASVAQNKTCNNPVLHTDITATIYALSGVSPGVTQDGFSFASYLTAPTTASLRDYAFIEYLGSVNAEDVTSYRCVRSNEWKYIEYTTGEKELYDMRNDPFELTNAINNPAMSKTVTALAALVAQGTSCSGADCIL